MASLSGLSRFARPKSQARAAFEDSLAREYREIAATLPVAAFRIDLPAGPAADLDEAELKAMMRYFDLSSEQLRLIDEGRIEERTAAVWKSGIRDLLSRPAFKAAWAELDPALPPDFFEALRSFLECQEPAGR